MTAIPKVRLLLRSIYLKGHMDGHKKTSDMSWEEDILSELRQMVGKMKKELTEPIYQPAPIIDIANNLHERSCEMGFNTALDSVMEKLK